MVIIDISLVSVWVVELLNFYISEKYNEICLYYDFFYLFALFFLMSGYFISKVFYKIFRGYSFLSLMSYKKQIDT